MARQKKTSKIIEGANTRSASLASIDPALDLGNGLTLAAYDTAIAAAQKKLDSYNTALSDADAAKNVFEKAEKGIADLSERMLSGVGTKFTKDSDEYEQAGGTKKSERKKPMRKAAAKSAKAG
jgi:hypothetical protein